MEIQVDESVICVSLNVPERNGYRITQRIRGWNGRVKRPALQHYARLCFCVANLRCSLKREAIWRRYLFISKALSFHVAFHIRPSCPELSLYHYLVSVCLAVCVYVYVCYLHACVCVRVRGYMCLYI